MKEKVLRVRTIELGPGPRGDGVRDPVPAPLKVAVNMAREDISNPVLLEQRRQPAAALRRQAVMVFAAPGVKERRMEKNQAGLVVPGLFQLSCQPADFRGIRAGLSNVIEDDEIVASQVEGKIPGAENLGVQLPLGVSRPVRDCRSPPGGAFGDTALMIGKSCGIFPTPLYSPCPPGGWRTPVRGPGPFAGAGPQTRGNCPGCPPAPQRSRYPLSGPG